jgi:hypothetical protein
MPCSWQHSLNRPKKHLVEHPIIGDNGLYVNGFPKVGVLEYWSNGVHKDKFEAQNSKHETIPKFECLNDRNVTAR